MSLDEKMTALADEVRRLSGASGLLGVDAMTAALADVTAGSNMQISVTSKSAVFREYIELSSDLPIGREDILIAFATNYKGVSIYEQWSYLSDLAGRSASSDTYTELVVRMNNETSIYNSSLYVSADEYDNYDSYTGDVIPEATVNASISIRTIVYRDTNTGEYNKTVINGNTIRFYTGCTNTRMYTSKYTLIHIKQ